MLCAERNIRGLLLLLSYLHRHCLPISFCNHPLGYRSFASQQEHTRVDLMECNLRIAFRNRKLSLTLTYIVKEQTSPPSASVAVRSSFTTVVSLRRSIPQMTLPMGHNANGREDSPQVPSGYDRPRYLTAFHQFLPYFAKFMNELNSKGHSK